VSTSVEARAADRGWTPEPAGVPGRLVAPKVYTFWKGRIALYGLLRALRVGPGSIVVVPGYTCFAVPLAVLVAGAEPLYADIDPETFNMPLSAIQAACGRVAQDRVRVIIVQHSYGIPAEAASIVAWARDRDIAVIEDCAHVRGSQYRDPVAGWQELGNLGDAAFFSSHWSKPVTTGLGGWARTSDPKLAAALDRFHDQECAAPSLRETLLVAAQVRIREVFSAPWVYWLARRGYRWLAAKGIFVGSSTPEELQGAEPRASDYAKRMGGLQEKLLQRRWSETSVIDHRRRLKTVYDAGLRSAGLPVLSVRAEHDPILLCYPVRVPDKKRVLEEAERRRIELGDWYRYPVDRPDGVGEEVFHYRTGTCPEGERASREVVTLPMHMRVTDAAAHRIVRFLKEVA